MVLGTTFFHAARSALGTRWNRTGPLPAFRNACLAVLTIVGVVVAGDPTSPQLSDAGPKTENAAPTPPPPTDELTLPSPELVQKPKAAPAALPPKRQAAVTSSVLLPPIQAPPSSSAIPLPSRALPFQQAARKTVAPPSLLEPPPPFSAAPQPTADTTLEVIVGQPRVLTFPDVPHRIALAVNENDPLATLQEVPHRPCEWYLIGKKPGTTYLDVWLPDPTNATAHRVLHHLVRILPDGPKPDRPIDKPVVRRFDNPTEKPVVKPTEKPSDFPQGASLYQTLEQEINRTFTGSTVQLKQVGDMLVVSGAARNIFEATRILSIARENAPGARAGESSGTPPAAPSLQATLDNYAHVGGPRVVNLLRIPGEQQIMLRIVVAEVNRAAARSLGLDFGIGDKQATILSNRPGETNGSPTVAANGWIGQLIRTLQDLHYAQSLAEPTLTTLNGQAARFQAGGEFPIPVVTPSPQGPVQSVAFRTYGVHLSVQPVLADADRIRLTVDAEVSGMDAQAAAQVASTGVPGLKVRNFQSTVELREGETLAVAGLVRGAGGNTLPQSVRPGADNTPPSEQELVVLISPLLLHPPSNERVEGANPLNAQDIELYLRSRNVPLPRGDALYLIGPQGYAGRMTR
jgi:pilus assembly protein CpaC